MTKILEVFNSDIGERYPTVDDVQAERAVGIMVIVVMIDIVKGKSVMIK